MLGVIRGESQSSKWYGKKSGADVMGMIRIRNKAKLRPIDLVDPRNKDLRTVLQTAEMAATMSSDIVNEDEDAPDGPGSESD